MEVEEEPTSNHPQEEESTVVKDDGLSKDTSDVSNKESAEKENSESKSIAVEEMELTVSVPVPELADSAVAGGEKAAGEEVVLDCRNLESVGEVAALSGGVENLVAVESSSVLGDAEFGVDMTTVVCGGVELTHSTKVEEGEGGVVEIEQDNVEAVEEKEENSGEVTDMAQSLVSAKGKDEGDEGKSEDEMKEVKELQETELLKGDIGDGGNVVASLTADVKDDVGGSVQGGGGAEDLKDDGGGNVELEKLEICQVLVDENGKGDGVTEDVKDDVGGNFQLEKVENMQGWVDVKDGGGNFQLEKVENIQGLEVVDVQTDGGENVTLKNIENVQGDEAMTEVQDDVKEGVVADDSNEEEMVAKEEEAVGVGEAPEEEQVDANEEEAVGVGEDIKEEVIITGEEKAVGIGENDDEEEAMVADEEKSLDTEMETEEEATMADEEKVQDAEIQTPESSVKGNGGRRKRGAKVSKATTKSPVASRKTIEEDVCFICFDGGDLVLCDRRNCPKAYHPSCVNRDEAFFQSKGRWNCGWHLCSICEKKAEYMCYTCTFSLCKSCIKTSVILCVREKEKKGFCEACMKTVMLIEKNEQENQGNVDFDDKSSWEYLFKDYWTDMKAKLNLSLDELAEAKNPWKGSELAGKQESPAAQSDVKDDGGSGSDNPSENLEAKKSRRRKPKKRKSEAKEEGSSTRTAGVSSEGTSATNNTEWASKELLEFVMHMRNGDKSVISQFDVQALLLEYIKTNKLRDSRKKSQIVCDARLESLFGKARVGHFEMLKLLESHFLIKEDSQIDDIQGSVVDNEVSQVDDDETNETVAKGGKDRKRKMRRKGDGRGPQANREDYAAIDIHNISVIYLRRKLVEDLLDDTESFHDKVVGTFVRIRISGANQKQDIYRLVQVTGTSKAEPYKLGKRTTDFMLDILNLDKSESISIDTISNQDFTEDECQRLRQSIKCGLLKRLTVGDILDKAMELQAARVNDWLETEVVRLSHLRDRASDLGRKKELRECVEKLQVLKTPEERARRLEEFPVIHDDPTMDPNYESEDDADLDNKKEEEYKRSVGSRFTRRGRDRSSPGRGDPTPKDSWSGTPRSSGKTYEFSRNLPNKNFSINAEDATASFERDNENSWDQGRENIVQQPSILKKPSFGTDAIASPTDISASVAENAAKINETEKMWHYKDPSGKIQGPFSMVQLRKWSNNGYFPVDLRIWRKSEKEDDGMLLTDALQGRFTSVEQRKVSQNGQNYDHIQGMQSSYVNVASGQSQSRGWTTPSVEIPKSSPDGKRDSANLPSPTPNQSTVGWTGGQAGVHLGTSSYPSANEGLQSPTPNSAQVASSSVPSSFSGGNKEPNAMGSFGASAFPSQEPSSTVSVAVAPHNSEQGILVGSQSSLQSSQSGLLVAAPDSNMPPQIVHSVTGQNSNVGTHGWSSAPPQNLQPNPSMNVAGQQQLAYNHWGGGVPNMVQNPTGNFLPQSAPLHQPEPWGQLPVPVNQPNMQQPPPQQQPNVTWGTMSANQNMGWVGPTPGNPNMNWAPTAHGPQVPGNVNPTWVMQAGHPAGAVQVQGPVTANVNPGWVPAPPVQGVLPNQGWIAAPTQGPVVTGNGNPSWGPQPGNQGTPNPGWSAPTGNPGPANSNTGWVGGPQNQGGPVVQGPGPGNANMGWGPPTGNQGVPSTNQGWGSPAPRGQGTWGGEQQHNRDGYSGQKRNRGPQGGGSGFRGGKRQWRQGSFNREGGSFQKGGSFYRGGSRDSARSPE